MSFTSVMEWGRGDAAGPVIGGNEYFYLAMVLGQIVSLIVLMLRPWPASQESARSVEVRRWRHSCARWAGGFSAWQVLTCFFCVWGGGYIYGFLFVASLASGVYMERIRKVTEIALDDALLRQLKKQRRAQ